MLTPTEESGLRTILEDLIDSDLVSLAETVTKKLIPVKDRNDAVKAILSCAEKPTDLLKRQRVTKRVLFGYLQKVKQVVSPECTKQDLVMMCLSEWKSTENCKESDYLKDSSATASQGLSESGRGSSPDDVSLAHQGDRLTAMGVQFVRWFFPMLNNLQGFGPEHFWNDCRLKAALKTALEVKEVDLTGDFDAATFMSGMVTNDRFYFDANSGSVECEQDPHGLVRIVISGVVHRFSSCIGLFDCWFGLVRNPALDSWKIKIVQIKIEVTSMGQPRIMPFNQCQSITQEVNLS